MINPIDGILEKMNSDMNSLKHMDLDSFIDDYTKRYDNIYGTALNKDESFKEIAKYTLEYLLK